MLGANWFGIPPPPIIIAIIAIGHSFLCLMDQGQASEFHRHKCVIGQGHGMIMIKLCCIRFSNKRLGLFIWTVNWYINNYIKYIFSKDNALKSL